MSAGKLRFAVVIERGESNYSAYVPDLAGCIATGDSIEETMRNIRAAIRLHVDGLREDGMAVPAASTQVEYLEIDG